MKIFSPTISGSSQASGSLTISGSLTVSQGITGSLLGTASWAINVINGGGGSTDTGSLLKTASVNLNTITFTKGDGSTFPITVNTGSGGGGSVGTLAQVTALGASTTVPITASIISASSFTGSLFGTASWANNARTSSFLPVGTYSITSSWATNALTSSFVNNLNQNLSITGAVILSGSPSPELRVIGDTQFTGSVSSLNGFTGSLLGTSSWATNALTASFLPIGTYNMTASWAQSASNAINARTASFLPVGTYSVTSSWATNALTASFVNTLNQNLIITGAVSIGTSSVGPNENTLTLGARDTTSEGGQLGLNAPGGTYTSASMVDNYQNQFRILRGTNANSTGLVASWNLHTLQMQLPAYTNASSFTGTATANLAVDSGGNVITVSTAGGTVFPYVGNAVITGSLTTTGIIYAQPNGGMYFQGGDDAALYDINVANHIGIYGVQDSTVGAIKLGSNGPVLYGSGSKLGIGTTNPSSASLTINGNVWANSFTGSLFGTASHAITASYALSSAGGGGGSFSLAGATDVSFSALTDGDLIRYNGTAGKWQNTNLGLSLTPTLSAIEGGYFGGYTKITNWGNYSDPLAKAFVKSGSTVIITCSVDSSGQITWSDSNSNYNFTRSLEVQVQDFGDIASEITTASYVKQTASFRYYRWFAVSASSNVLLNDFRFYSGSSQSSTAFPANMTSNTAPTPYVASASSFYVGYEPWEAFDSDVNSQWWNLAAPPYQGAFVSVDMGSTFTSSLRSMKIQFGQSFQNFTVANIQGSNDNATWTTLHTITNVPANNISTARNFG